MRFISLLLCLLLSCSAASYAGFVIRTKPATVTTGSAGEHTDTDSTRKVRRLKSRSETFQDGPPYKLRTNHRRAHDRNSNQGTGGGLGIAALVFACLGYWPLALILGAMGMGRGRRNSGLARAAFIVGLVEAAITILMLALIFIIFV